MVQEIVQADPRSKFIKEMFQLYYNSVEIPAPGKLEQREFGVITERGGMWRHLGFPNLKELQDFLKKQVPIHAYHSSTYYQKPNARTMDEKGWLGADLIFDLDADHIKDTENMSMEKMFQAVKVQFLKLIDSYLLGDFGFEEKDLKIVFSGGRGYHAHISNSKVLGLSSHERREIVDYITCPNPEIDGLLIKKPWDSQSFQGHDNTKYKYRLHPPDTPGWKGKVTASVLEFIRRTEPLSREEVLDELSEFKGIGDNLALKIYESLYKGEIGARGIDKIRNLNLEPFSSDKVRNSFINYIVKEMSVQLGGETDEPVTSDIKRLIRLPGSLHGKTSLVVRTLNVNELRGFDPLRDSVWEGFTNDTLKVRGVGDFDIKLQNKEYILRKDVDIELPGHAALFFSCQKKCDIII